MDKQEPPNYKYGLYNRISGVAHHEDGKDHKHFQPIAGRSYAYYRQNIITNKQVSLSKLAGYGIMSIITKEIEQGAYCYGDIFSEKMIQPTIGFEHKFIQSEPYNVEGNSSGQKTYKALAHSHK